MNIADYILMCENSKKGCKSKIKKRLIDERKNGNKNMKKILNLNLQIVRLRGVA